MGYIYCFILVTPKSHIVAPEHVLWAIWHKKNFHWSDLVIRTTGQPRLSAIVQARCLSLFGHIARMPDETDARSIIFASPSENWRKPPGRPRTTIRYDTIEEINVDSKAEYTA